MVFRNSKQKVYFNKTEGGNMTIGNKIKNLRNLCQLTQEELADRCELTKGYISQLENDLTSPSISTLKKKKNHKLFLLKRTILKKLLMM